VALTPSPAAAPDDVIENLPAEAMEMEAPIRVHPGHVRRAGSDEEVIIPSKATTTLHKGDRLVIETEGGGGYGDPRGRSGEHVRNGKVGADAARSVYGQGRRGA
jgi:N-methylhydantoinase B/oxoprolinase/acetone carboxylase alpha subunit